MIEDKKIYHIVFKTKESDFYSKGVNVEAKTIEEAVEEFKNTFVYYEIYVVYLNLIY